MWPMLAQSHARKPAPQLAARGMWLRRRVGADAFGSALGDSVVGAIQRGDAKKTPPPPSKAEIDYFLDDTGAINNPAAKTKTDPSLLDRAFQALSGTVTSAKELAFGVVKLPFDFIGGALSASIDHALGRADKDKSYFSDLVDKSFGALAEGVRTTAIAATSEFRHFDEIHRSVGDSLGHIVGDIPLIGGLLYGGQRPDTEGGVRGVFLSSGINGGSPEAENTRLDGLVAHANGAGLNAKAVPYPYGTLTDVAFSLLNLSHGYSYDFADQVLNNPGVGRGMEWDLAGQSGGVQRVLDASKILGDMGVGINSIVGTQGPALGRFNNANNIVLTGNATNVPGTRQNQMSSDPISWGGRLLSDLVIGNNVVTDFKLTAISDRGDHHSTPWAGNLESEAGMGPRMIQDLLLHRPK
jgi:hypothetical protein